MIFSLLQSNSRAVDGNWWDENLDILGNIGYPFVPKATLEIFLQIYRKTKPPLVIQFYSSQFKSCHDLTMLELQMSPIYNSKTFLDDY